MAYTYILRMCDGSYYVGSCRNLQSRIDQHRYGYVRSTKSKLPLEVVYAREYSEYSVAAREEQRIKGWKKRKAIENLVVYDKYNLISAPSSSPV